MKCLILCSKVLLKVQHNMSVKIVLPWQHTGFQTSPMHFSLTSTFYFHIWKWCLICTVQCMIQQTHKYVSSGLWPCLVFFELKITNIIILLKSSGWVLEQSESPWEQNFYSHRCVSYRTISLPSFNDLDCKLAKIALFMYLR